jgi:type II secretory pathway component PulM
LSEKRGIIFAVFFAVLLVLSLILFNWKESQCKRAEVLRSKFLKVQDRVEEIRDLKREVSQFEKRSKALQVSQVDFIIKETFEKAGVPVKRINTATLETFEDFKKVLVSLSFGEVPVDDLLKGVWKLKTDRKLNSQVLEFSINDDDRNGLVSGKLSISVIVSK